VVVYSEIEVQPGGTIKNIKPSTVKLPWAWEHPEDRCQKEYELSSRGERLGSRCAPSLFKRNSKGRSELARASRVIERVRCKQLEKRRIARQVQTVHDGIEKIADQRLSFPVPARADRRGNRNIVLAGVFPQEHGKERKKTGEPGHVLGSR